MSQYQDVALLKLDSFELIPTEVGRKNRLVAGKDLKFRSFDIGPQVATERAKDNPPYENHYRQFKADLSHKASVLNSDDGRKWDMKTLKTDQGHSHCGGGELIDQNGSEYIYFNPKTAAHVLLRKLCKRVVRQSRDITGIDNGIKVHFTAPAYTGSDSDKSQRYRDHIRDIVEEFRDDRAFSGVDFAVERHDLLYEPYGVYYYYALIQESISKGKYDEPKTYFIYDMGGSTTDVGIVQVSSQGDVTRAYPICKSIDCAGSYLDRYILKFLRSDDRLKEVSAKWNPEFKKVEEAKIALCTGKTDEARLEIMGDTYILTRDAIADALEELWNDDNRPLARGFRGFIDDVRSNAKENQYFSEFDSVDKVFLAGGSTDLPGLKDLIFSTLSSSRFDLVEDEATKEELFETPTYAKSSSVTSLGQAAELADEERSLVLSRAESVYAKIFDHNGDNCVFRRRTLTQPDEKQDGETLLVTVEELKSKLSANESSGEFDNEYQHCNLSDDRPFPEEINISLRTEFSEYPEEPQIQAPVKGGLEEEAARRDRWWLNLSCQAEYEGDSLKLKPFVFFEYPSESDGPRRLYEEQGTQRISLKPEKDDGRLHICIDLGMNNTSVAICTPGQSLPEGHENLRILQPDDSQARDGKYSKKQESAGEGGMVGGGGAASVPASSHTKGDNSSANIVESTIHVPDELLSKIEAIFEQIEPGNTSPVADTLTDEVVPLLKSIQQKLDTDTTENGTESDTSAPPGYDILDKIAENTESLGDRKEAEDDFSDFADFIHGHEEQLHYPDDVLRSVWMHIRSSNSRLAILAGPPGSGKSSLVRLTAEFLNKDVGKDYRSFYHLEPVSPSWFSPSSLLGSYSEIDGQYHETEFLRFLIAAEQHYDHMKDSFSEGYKYVRPFLACLDEFNIAQPEQYMSDLLSKMETANGQKSDPITLCRKDKMGWTSDLEVCLPPNLNLFATINTDASTKTLSPKVLDRSVFIRLTPDYEDLKEVGERLKERYDVSPVHDALFDEDENERGGDASEPASLLGDLMMVARHAQTPFGYRVLEQAYEHASYDPRLNRNIEGVVDNLIANFFLSKLPGSHAVSNPMEYIEAIGEDSVPRLRSDSYPKSSKILEAIEGGLPGQAAV